MQVDKNYFNPIVGFTAQPIGVHMSGRKIDDHSSWIGSGGKYPLPMESKMKSESSAEGFGDLSHYEDTTEAIKSQQEMHKRKVHGHKMKEGYRQ